MANNKTIYSRFYPKNNYKIDHSFWNEVINEMILEIEFWNIIYWIHPENKYVDFSYEGKPRNELPELFDRKQILDKYDIWIRLTDEGGFSDIIGFKSNSNSFNIKSNSKALNSWGYVLRNWNYSKICYYSSDQLKFTFDSTEIEFKNNFLGRVVLDELTNNVWLLNTDTLYSKCTKMRFGKFEKISNLDVFNSKQLVIEGEMSQAINDYSLFKIGYDFLHAIKFSNKDKLQRRIFNNLVSLEFLNNGVVYEKFIWDEKNWIWDHKSSIAWDNCLDYELNKYLSKKNN